MIGDKTRRRSRKVKKVHKEVTSKGLLGSTQKGGLSKKDINYTYGILDGNTVKEPKTVSPKNLNIEDLVTLAEKGDVIIKADIEDVDDPFAFYVGDAFIESAFAKKNKTAIYYKFDKLSKTYDI